MEGELFETSETLAEFLGSTQLLSESWKLCNLANTTAPHSLVVDQIEEVGYVAFSGVQSVIGDNLVAFEESSSSDGVSCSNGNGPFSSSCNREDGEEPAMVHSGFLNVFLNMYHSPIFRSQMEAMMNRSKAVIITGHSIGGAIASLTALWLLSSLQSFSSPLSILCITFGSPLLGNESLSKAILRERWGGKFCHVVSKDDLVPRLFFAPIASITSQLNYLLQLWQFSMTSPQLGQQLAMQLTEEARIEFYHYILSHVAAAAAAGGEGSMNSSYRPFGSYLLCSEKGAVCVENATAVVQMLHLMFITSSPNSIIDDHLKYGDVVAKISQQFLKSRSFTEGVLPGSSYEVGISLALEASGIVGQDLVAEHARECLKMAKQMGQRPNLNSANLAISLAKVTPYRAEIEWYKSLCDESDDQMGYYDSFKNRAGISKRDHKVNMNRFMLAGFWDKVIYMLETNQLPHDFHFRAKFVNASHFYKLLVEPLDIAEYYKTGMHKIKGHYLMHGRERRYVIFDRWWGNRKEGGEDNRKRSKYAGLTQDSCFWAKVEEAKDCLDKARSERDPSKLAQLWENMNKFEFYSSQLIDKKEVSKDVVAKNSSYSLWVEEWKELKYQLTQISYQFPGNLRGESSSFAFPRK
ncbi:lipase-like PAD4 [Telopea speciosissima]|uniref:lipase-like PAD4 n=1 Tax=Telopea speciosissima TaxID=54955 RepID=UPI001CC4008C|nr:lipase-like PAD4 [Telopea speciosissima]